MTISQEISHREGIAELWEDALKRGLRVGVPTREEGIFGAFSYSWRRSPHPLLLQ
jgi:hypothetical protein